MKCFIFGAITADEQNLAYMPEDCEERKKFEELLVRMPPDDPEDLRNRIRKFTKSMIKTGAAKTADIMIPSDQKFSRFRKFVEI